MNKKYQFFWEWFLNHKKEIEEINLNHLFIKDLEAKIKILGDFIWEIGPGLKKPFAFTISPGGDPALLVETKEIISYAPALEEWEFYYSKQIKEWDNYFDIFINGEKRRIDISKWEYVLFEYEDNTLDIIIKPVPYSDTYNKDIYGICEMVLDSIIGEEMRIEKIQDLEVVREFDSNIEENGTSIINLQKHLKKIGVL